MTNEVRSLDLLGTSAPALSTTSDMPTVATKIDPPKGAVSEAEIAAGGTEALKAKEKTDADAKAASDAKAAEGKGGDKPADDKAADKEIKEPKTDDTPAWQKREITKAKNRQREAETRASALEERLDKALTALEKAATRSDSKVETTDTDPRPKRADFDDPEKYDEALVHWSAKTAAKVTQAEIEKTNKERQATETKERTERETQVETQKRVDAWGKSKTAALEKYADFLEVAESDDVPITPPVAYAILEENLDNPGIGPEIAYHLGKHPEEAEKIAALKTQSAVDRAIGRLAERLSKPILNISKTPEPPKPVGARSRATSKSPADESMEEYAARRNAELKQQRANPH